MWRDGMAGVADCLCTKVEGDYAGRDVGHKKRKMGYKEKYEDVRKTTTVACKNGVLHGPQPCICAIDDDWNLGRGL